MLGAAQRFKSSLSDRTLREDGGDSGREKPHREHFGRLRAANYDVPASKAGEG